MIVYFDTSAFIPLIVLESGTPTALRLWDQAESRLSSRLIVVEAAAAAAMGRRLGRLTEDEHAAVQEDVWRHATNMTLIDAFGDVVNHAATLAVEHALRGYDAMHLATAMLVQARDVVFASADQKLLHAAHAEGFTTIDTSTAPRAGT